MSKKFDTSRGARQGDPIASYIFIICIEILAFKLRADSHIIGFELDENTRHLLELYADDCSIFLQPSEECLRYSIHVLDQFYKLSGLKISVQKTLWPSQKFGTNIR